MPYTVIVIRDPLSGSQKSKLPTAKESLEDQKAARKAKKRCQKLDPVLRIRITR